MIVRNGPDCGRADLSFDSGSVLRRGVTEHVSNPHRRLRSGQADLSGARDLVGGRRGDDAAAAWLAGVNVLFQAAIPPVRMETYGGAHFWGPEIVRFCHQVRLMPPRYVEP
jgi:hypothetical protein